MSQRPSIERGFYGYIVVKRPDVNNAVDFNDIRRIMEFIEDTRSRRPIDLLVNVPGRTDHLYLAEVKEINLNINGAERGIVLKLGWARQAGYPQALDTSSWRISYIMLDNRYYLFEPSHFLIFPYRGHLVSIHEFNYYGPRASRLCYYLGRFAKQALGRDEWTCHMRRLTVSDIAKRLQSYRIVRGLWLELEKSAIEAARASAEQAHTVFANIFQNINLPGSKRIIIGLQSDRWGHLNVDINYVLSLFRELIEEFGEGLLSFKVKVKKDKSGRTETIDLLHYFFVARRRVDLAVDESGNPLRAVDTRSVIEALREIASEASKLLD